MAWVVMIHSPHAASLVYSPLPSPHSAAIQGLKKLSKMQLYHVRHVTQIDHSNNDYITAFHLAGRPPVSNSQPCATDMDSGLYGLLNACHPVTIYTSVHTDIADSPMFSLAPMLLMSDFRCTNRPNSNFWETSSPIPSDLCAGPHWGTSEVLIPQLP